MKSLLFLVSRSLGKEFVVSEISLASSAFSHDKSGLTMIRECGCNKNDRRKPNWEKHLHQFHFGHHKSHMVWPGILLPGCAWRCLKFTKYIYINLTRKLILLLFIIFQLIALICYLFINNTLNICIV